MLLRSNVIDMGRIYVCSGYIGGAFAALALVFVVLQRTVVGYRGRWRWGGG